MNRERMEARTEAGTQERLGESLRHITRANRAYHRREAAQRGLWGLIAALLLSTMGAPIVPLWDRALLNPLIILSAILFGGIIMAAAVVHTQKWRGDDCYEAAVKPRSEETAAPVGRTV